MRSCSVTKKLKIVPGRLDDYRKLARFHYRNSKLTGYSAIYAMRLHTETVGVIVYTMPSAGAELRNIATGNLFAGLDRRTQLGLINKNIRCIGRVVIEPRFRGLGLAARLVRETLGKIDVPIVEAMAVMGWVNPFFEKAGMTAYRAKEPAPMRTDERGVQCRRYRRGYANRTAKGPEGHREIRVGACRFYRAANKMLYAKLRQEQGHPSRSAKDRTRIKQADGPAGLLYMAQREVRI